MLPWKEWGRAAEDPEDMLASMALGSRAYGACVNAADLPPRKGHEGAVTAFAHILHHMLDELDEDRLLELRYVLQEGWRETSPGLWEPPEAVIWPIGKDMRTELLSLRHCVERAIGPDLLRLSWAAMTSAGRSPPLLSMEAGTGLFLPLAMLDRMRAEDVPPFLEDEEREGMAFLRSELSAGGGSFIDEIASELTHQRHVLRDGRLFIEARTSGGRWFDMDDVLRWRERGLRSCSLLLAFRVMFLASVTGESGGLRVSFPD